VDGNGTPSNSYVFPHQIDLRKPTTIPYAYRTLWAKNPSLWFSKTSTSCLNLILDQNQQNANVGVLA
jgi:hypothetical protein